MTERCSPREARWCPNHGDCLCVEYPGGVVRHSCPLHAPRADHPSTLGVDGEDGRTYVEGRAIAEHRPRMEATLVFCLEDDWRRAWPGLCFSRATLASGA